MTVTFKALDGKSEELTPGLVFFALPKSGSISVNESGKTIYINGLPRNMGLNGVSIPIETESIRIESDGLVYDINVLCQETPDEMKFDYNLLGRNYTNNLIGGKLDLETFNLAISEDDAEDTKLTLCTFNRKFSDVTREQGLEEMSDCVDRLPHIFQKPKQHLKQVNEVRPAALASRIGQESISHLASHSEHWKGIKASGLIPERLLARTLEDDYAIYENLVVKTLVDKLYKKISKLNSDNLDCTMQMEMGDGLSFGSEQKSYFHARDVLLKGMDDDSVQYNQLLLEEQGEYIQHILDRLAKCKSAPLYRQLKKQRPIVGKLKKTNIFMMDKYYKYAYRLWDLANNEPVAVDDTGIDEICNEYSLFCKLLFVFALQYFNFTLPDEEDIFIGESFSKAEFTYKNWTVSMVDVEVSKMKIPSFAVKIAYRNIIYMQKSLADYGISENLLPNWECLRVDNGILGFSRVLSDSEQEQLTKAVKKAWADNKQRTAMFKQDVYASCINHKERERNILFVPWKYLMPNNSEAVEKVFDKLTKIIDSEAYDKVFITTPSRPNEYDEVKDENVLNKMISYGMANQETGLKASKFGFIPICMSDINSYRRYTKILLEYMIELDENQINCPICGEELSHGKGSSKNICSCANCNFEVILTKCSNCSKEYNFTRYMLPRTMKVKDIPGFKVLGRENVLAYKNITEAYIEDNQIHPICPYCGN